jgi:hypothetical protein
MNFHIEKGDLDIAIFPSPEKIIPPISRGELSLYHPISLYCFSLLILSLILVVLTFISIWNKYSIYKFLLQNNSSFKDLDSFEQFHSAIGFWTIIFFFMSIFMVAGSVTLFSEITHITQYPSTSSFIVFGASSGILVMCALRWTMIWPKVYRVAYIINFGFKRIIDLILDKFLFSLFWFFSPYFYLDLFPLYHCHLIKFV